MSKNERPHYTLNVQSGRHVATQKLVLPKQLQPPAQTPVTPPHDKASDPPPTDE